jgi:hypothetical protein
MAAAYTVIDEVIMAGELQESSLKKSQWHLKAVSVD